MQRATITKPGVPGRSEPYALLADGREMPMGWNMGKTFEVGQTGIAEYVSASYASLWRFTPDEGVAERIERGEVISDKSMSDREFLAPILSNDDEGR